MTRVHHFRRADLAAQPWKNGGGETREVVSWPRGATVTNFDWRVSIAHIASNGPFSPFPGVDRVITLLEGDGVVLRGTDGAVHHRLDQALAPYAFAGEATIEAGLLGPDCHDFNVMTRRAVCSASVQVLHNSADLPCPAQGLFFAVAGQWRANEQLLAPNEGLWWEDGAETWTLAPLSEDARLIAVLIQPAI